jgi:A/G-specific adenine glycosylase
MTAAARLRPEPRRPGSTTRRTPHATQPASAALATAPASQDADARAVPAVADGQLAAVQARLLEWYRVQGRDLPWRRTRDPYAILVAEVMLQQTQVDRVIPKWQAWLAQFPTLRDLAAASRADVIRAWQGLGYNLRAVRLHEIARAATARYDGRLPADLDALLGLPGIGRYTAGAIASFAFEQPVAMVDTNIRRVLGRVFWGTPPAAPSELAAREVQALADAVLPQAGPTAYAWNQALMDLGATVCRAQQPLCLICPLMGACRAQAGLPLLQHDGGPARTARPRPKQPPFEQTDRYLRGRIVDAVRALEPGQVLSRDHLAARLPAHAPARLDRLLGALAADGLIGLAPDGSIHLPV